MNSLLKVAKEMYTSFCYEATKELGKIATLLRIITPVIIVTITADNIVLMLVISIMWNIITSYIDAVYRELNHVAESGMPLPTKPLTEDNNGLVSLKKGNESDAIIYLNSVEEYLKSKGLI